MKLIIAVALLAAVVLGDEEQRAVEAPGEKELVKQLIPQGIPAHKSKRQASATPTCGVPSKLNQAQQTETCTVHNQVRAAEAADNMVYLTWNTEMANVAQAYANQCIWAHGGLQDCEGNAVGQNLFVAANSAGYPALNMTNVILSWNSERAYWNFGSNTCNAPPGAMCGHYTQNVWARSFQVGCGYALCPTISVSGQTWTNAILVACDYTPAGNIIGGQMFESGPACSKCDYEGTGAGYKCLNGLCYRCTPATDPACACGQPQACQNGASWDPTQCACACGNKFWGVQCQNACSCADAMDCSGYTQYCTQAAYQQFMQTNCCTTCKMPCNLPSTCSQ